MGKTHRRIKKEKSENPQAKAERIKKELVEGYQVMAEENKKFAEETWPLCCEVVNGPPLFDKSQLKVKKGGKK